MGNAIAIVGRPNVGKSTFFNRLVGRREAIMDDFSGVTRDRNYGYADWCGKYFSVIDTGGYVEGSEDIFEEEIRKQVKIAVDEASVIYFMVDINDGVTDLDRDFAKFLRRTQKPVFIIANKADTPSKGNFAGEFYSLGMGEVYSVSSQNGSGTGELLDETIKHFQDEMPEDPYAGIPRIALVGRPNVGKSSLLNVLMGEERHIVTDIAGTTRDSIDSHYNSFGKEFILTDTAGIRKKGKVHEDIEFYSVMRSIKAIENSDICVILIDAQTGLESQDMNIIALADKNKKGIVLVANKWDLVEKDHTTSKKFEEDTRKKTMPIDYYPIVFTSVLTKQRIFNVLEKVEEVYANKTKKISTSTLNDVMLREINNYPPPSTKGKFIKIKYVTQLPTPSPTFAFFCNLPQYIAESYVRFLENKIRLHFGYEGVHIHVVFRKK